MIAFVCFQCHKAVPIGAVVWLVGFPSKKTAVETTQTLFSFLQKPRKTMVGKERHPTAEAKMSKNLSFLQFFFPRTTSKLTEISLHRFDWFENKP